MTEENKTNIIKKETYVKAVSSTGKSSVNNGDEVAAALAGIDIDCMYKVSANFLKDGKEHDTEISQEELREKYGHLNIGMQRMSLGNRIRSACTSSKNAYVEVHDLVTFVDENCERTGQAELKEAS